MRIRSADGVLEKMRSSTKQAKNKHPKTTVNTNNAKASKSNSANKDDKVKSKKQPKNKAALSFRQLMKRGEASLMRGSVGQARKLFNRAKKMRPKSPDPLSQLAWCEMAHKRVSNAISLFKKALSISSRHADSLYGLGYAYEKIGNASNAVKYFEKYLKRYPSGPKVGVINNKMRRLQR